MRSEMVRARQSGIARVAIFRHAVWSRWAARARPRFCFTAEHMARRTLAHAMIITALVVVSVASAGGAVAFADATVGSLTPDGLEQNWSRDVRGTYIEPR
jgi:ABC-type uncharacterized transport system YnjBCD permease subunit